MYNKMWVQYNSRGFDRDESYNFRSFEDEPEFPDPVMDQLDNYQSFVLRFYYV